MTNYSRKRDYNEIMELLFAIMKRNTTVSHYDPRLG